MARLTSDEKPIDPQWSSRLVDLITPSLQREYPNKIGHIFRDASDVQPPHVLSPAFYGCFDWHSAVHSHWALVRLLKTGELDDERHQRVETAIDHCLTAAKIAVEVAALSPPERVGFEMPYGMAWLLQLGKELRELDHPKAAAWFAALRPLEQLACERVEHWLGRLSHPIRSGVHSQTAFALGLVWDWARCCDAESLLETSANKTRSFFLEDQNAPINYEPSGCDFLSPILSEADLLRRILDPDEFSSWLSAFLPQLWSADDFDLLHPVVPVDRADNQLVHLDGLNLSRAWMLRGIASQLEQTDDRVDRLLRAAARHGEEGMQSLSDTHYAGAHWLGSFAVYWLGMTGLNETF